ncbi:putative F-box protein At1g49610 [Salvia miltiorrhiza]|uniref:putative F-box protein At1g49610 n=1 Tax=Salvia miltiorrhiza TaxID=226208 RepID=UPI0025AC1A35|nr:putative F-box protein At1g49610 [Salvia miltiorrhiza]
MAESQSNQRGDRLSELPDSLILHILSFLPMRHVVQTTLLSKRWADLWRTVSSLTFDDGTNDAAEQEQFLEFPLFVNRAMSLWKGTEILKFHAAFDYTCWDYASSDLDVWLRVAMDKQVQVLSLNLTKSEENINRYHRDDDSDIDDGDFGGDDLYTVPPRLFSCSSIRELSLAACNVRFGGNVRWDKLEFLKIEGVRLSDGLVGRVVSGSPRLEVLILRVVESHDDLNIQSESLRRLTVEKYYRGDPAKHTMLTIWAPNLESLEILGVVYRMVVLVNVASLIDVDLGFCGWDECHGLLGEMMVYVFECICRARNVTLSKWCVKMLVMMKKRGSLSVSSDAKYLKLSGNKQEIIELLEMYPNLTTLVIEVLHGVREPEYPSLLEIRQAYFRDNSPAITTPKLFMKKLSSFSKESLMQLRRVEITWIATDTSVYPLIELVFKCSPLEKMVLRVQQLTSLQPPSMFVLTRKLLRMRRSSPAVEVSFFG